jgi:thiamine biosynthesis lipoprotein
MGQKQKTKSRPDSRPNPLIFTATLILLLACGDKTETVLNGDTMGTTYQVRLHAPSSSLELQKLKFDIDRELTEFNARFSNWDSQSEVSRLNRSTESGLISVSGDMHHMLTASLSLARSTRGAFDPTVPPLLRAWGFGPGQTNDEGRRVPGDEEIARAMRRVGYAKLSLPVKMELLKAPGVELDFSAIAKGGAVDRVFEDLERAGVNTGMMVEIGGEIRVSSRADGRPWRVGLERPRYDGARDLLRVAYVHRGAVATSGDYRNYFEKDGQRYAPVIDPRTGRPARGRLASATVIGPDCMTADALATALLVLGREAGMQVCESDNFKRYECLLLEHKPTQANDDAPNREEYEELLSSGMRRFLDPEGGSAHD